MEVVCEQCKSKLSIPNGKIPRGQRVAVSCPKCKHRLIVETPADDLDVTMFSAGKETDSAEALKDAFDEYGDQEDALEAYEEGVELALILGKDPNQAEKLKKGVDSLGYRCVLAGTTREAVAKMRLHHFALVIVPDGFEGIELDQSPVINYLDHLSMSIRRRMFVALIGNTFRTMDHMAAFAKSANLVVNEKDLDRLNTVLKKGVSDHKRFYKAFMETLQEVGRE
jgi:hypothetical protein